MPEIVTCPSCQRKLQVPESFFGQKVQCPTCNAQFTAEAPSRPSAVSPPSEPGQARDWDEPSRRRSAHDDYDDFPRSRSHAPHRGPLILTLGILSLVLTCAPLGIPAWIMGNRDLDLIRRGQMDPQGEGLTRAGQILGIIGTILGILAILLSCLWAFIVAGMLGQQGMR
jgi:hypothetical protein